MQVYAINIKKLKFVLYFKQCKNKPLKPLMTLLISIWIYEKFLPLRNANDVFSILKNCIQNQKKGNI